jgi:hypothetical protein
MNTNLNTVEIDDRDFIIQHINTATPDTIKQIRNILEDNIIYDPEYDEDYTSPFYQEILKRGQEINQALKTGEGLISFKSTEEFSDWLDKLVEEDEDEEEETVYNSVYIQDIMRK